MGLPVNFPTLLQIDASNKTSTYTAEATTLFDGDPQGTAGFLAMYLYLDSARTAPLRTVRTIYSGLHCCIAIPAQEQVSTSQGGPGNTSARVWSGVGSRWSLVALALLPKTKL
ncbi:hypothetical protein PG995_014246 [Apiospora arundinis]